MIEDSEFTTKSLDDSGEVLFGSGGTSDCYKRIIGNRAYCIKRPKPVWRQSEDYMNLFRKEFSLGIELEHPNIVRYFDYGEDERGPFIKMDYVDGDNLEQFAAANPDFFKSKKNRQQLLDELLDAMAYLHGKQMLHLDLKPGNILITNKGHHVKLIDMGFGWTEGFLHDAGFSRDYCAPEQLNNQTTLISAATDIYALGKIMQRYGLAKESVINRCLKENPRERFQTVEELKKALQPERWIVILLVLLVVGVLGWLVSTTIMPKEVPVVRQDTLYVVQSDTVFISRPEPVAPTPPETVSYRKETVVVHVDTVLSPFSYPKLTPLEDSLMNFRGYLEYYLLSSSVFIDVRDYSDKVLRNYERNPEKGREYLDSLTAKTDRFVKLCNDFIQFSIEQLNIPASVIPEYEKVGQVFISDFTYCVKQRKEKLMKMLEKDGAIVHPPFAF